MSLQRIAATTAFGLVVGLFAGAAVISTAASLEPVWEVVAWGIWLFAFAGVGLLLVFRRPGNAIAWLCLGFALFWAAQLASDSVLTHEMTEPGFIARPELLAVVADQLWVPGVVIVGFLLLLFPDGQLPSPRWRPLAWVLFVTMLLVMAYGFTRPGVFPDWDFTNPFGVEWVGRLVAVDYVLVACLILSLAACAVSVAVRFRRAGGPERQQLKWLMAAGIVSAVSYILLFVEDRVPWILAWTTIPVAIGFAVLRYRLYDIDRLVSRTLSYALVAGLLAATYFGTVVVLSVLLPSESNLAVAGSTLLVAILFNPLRRRTQHVVDRRFDRTRFDYSRVAEQFSADLRTQTDVAEIQTAMARVVDSTMRPTVVSMWVRPR